jgi:hypothetical protein
MNGERSFVQAMSAWPRSFAADHESTVKSSIAPSGPKPPSDCPSATTRLRLPVLDGFSRATSSARDSA